MNVILHIQLTLLFYFYLWNNVDALCDVSGYVEITGFCYKIFTSKQNYANAQSSCEADGAHLATITSAAETTDVLATFSGDQDFWFGMQQQLRQHLTACCVVCVVCCVYHVNYQQQPPTPRPHPPSWRRLLLMKLLAWRALALTSKQVRAGAMITIFQQFGRTSPLTTTSNCLMCVVCCVNHVHYQQQPPTLRPHPPSWRVVTPCLLLLNLLEAMPAWMVTATLAVVGLTVAWTVLVVRTTAALERTFAVVVWVIAPAVAVVVVAAMTTTGMTTTVSTRTLWCFTRALLALLPTSCAVTNPSASFLTWWTPSVSTSRPTVAAWVWPQDTWSWPRRDTSRPIPSR